MSRCPSWKASTGSAHRSARRIGGWTIAVLVALSSCATSRSQEPVQVRTRLSAARDVNPDGNGRPSPVVVKLYGLRADSEFSNADFFALADHGKQALASTFVMSQEYVLQPGEALDLRVAMPPETRYVGVVAEFRNIQGATWRALARAPRKRWTDTFSRDTLAIAANRGAITLAVKD